MWVVSVPTDHWNTTFWKQRCCLLCCMYIVALCEIFFLLFCLLSLKSMKDLFWVIPFMHLYHNQDTPCWLQAKNNTPPAKNKTKRHFFKDSACPCCNYCRHWKMNTWDFCYLATSLLPSSILYSPLSWPRLSLSLCTSFMRQISYKSVHKCRCFRFSQVFNHKQKTKIHDTFNLIVAV